MIFEPQKVVKIHEYILLIKATSIVFQVYQTNLVGLFDLTIINHFRELLNSKTPEFSS